MFAVAHRAAMLLVVIAVAGCGSTEPEPKSETASSSKPVAQARTSEPVFRRTYPAYVTAYDMQTPEDEFYYHHLHPLCDGPDFSEWPIIKSLVEVGQNLVDAPLWASMATETIYITDQPRAKPIIDVVNECAEILGIQPPPVHIDGNPEPNAYVAGIKEPHVLVFTSGLLDLYDESPDELRFIIGHELGHIKADHIRTHFVGRTFVGALLGDEGARASFAENFFAGASVHTLLHWFRESEYSADRAGLLCVGGDTRLASQALLRLLHQTKPSNKLFDPSHPDFDPELVLARQMRIREQPFVKVLSHMRQSRQSHPFIPERCAALRSWSMTSEYLTIMERQQRLLSDKQIIVTSVDVKNIPRTDTYVPLVDSGATDPFVRLTYAGQSSSTKHGVDMTTAKWSKLSITRPHTEGANLIVELFDYNTALANKLVGSCLVPLSDTTIGSHEVRANVQLDVEERSTVVDLPSVTITYTVASK